ncbi:hypothetical protein STEG23_012035 [Scotinomys teguina]
MGADAEPHSYKFNGTWDSLQKRASTPVVLNMWVKNPCDVPHYLLAKRKQFEKDRNASFRSLRIFKTQQKSRQELHSMHSQTFESLYHKWLEDVGRARKQEEHLTFIAQQQMKILQKDIEDRETNTENAKDLCETFLKVWWIALVHRTHPFMSHRVGTDGQVNNPQPPSSSSSSSNSSSNSSRSSSSSSSSSR